MVGTGGELKERGTRVSARISEYEYDLLYNISALGGGYERALKPNISEGVRFCINFTAKILAILPEALVEVFVEEKERELEEVKKKKGK
jgi:hypothetical protein